MIRFLLWTTVGSALSSLLGFPFVWRAVIVGWATSCAVLWAERICLRATTAESVRSGVFIACGILSGMAGGLLILALEYALGFPGPTQLFSSLSVRVVYEPKVAEFVAVPMVTTLCVLGVGWRHLNRQRARSLTVMFLLLLAASAIRCAGTDAFRFSSEGFAVFFAGMMSFFVVGTAPFALLWLVAARRAKQ